MMFENVSSYANLTGDDDYNTMKIRAPLFLMALAILAPVIAFSALALNMILDSERAAALASLHDASYAAKARSLNRQQANQGTFR